MQTCSFGSTYYAHGGTATSPTPTKTGYIFDGWSVTGTKDSSVTSLGANQAFSNLRSDNGQSVTLTAKWKPINYTVVFNNGDCGYTGTEKNLMKFSGTTAKQTFTYGVTQKLNANGFEMTYVVNGVTYKAKFVGWSTTKPTTTSRNTAVYSDTQSVSNLMNSQGATLTLYIVK